MARLPYLNASDLAPEHRDLLSRNMNLHRILAYSPAAARALSGVAMFIRHYSRLDPRLRELALLQVGYLCRAPYEWIHHVLLAREFGVLDDEIRAIADETAGHTTQLEPLARTVLRAAREITIDLAPSDETFAALQANLDSERLLDLVIAIAQYNAVVRILASMRIDLEEQHRHLLEQFPLPE
jgi:alkylhydroperoxidase family enzyme